MITDEAIAKLVARITQWSLRKVTIGDRMEVDELYRRNFGLVKEDIKRYFEMAFSRYSRTYTLISSTQPISIEDIYCGGDLIFDGSRINSDDVLASVLSHGKILITGVAGSGKSMLIRHFFCKLVRDNAFDKLPVIIEFRNLRDIGTDGDIIAKAIYRDVFFELDYIDVRIISAMMRRKQFLLLLDGLDELPKNRVTVMVNSLREMTNEEWRQPSPFHDDAGLVITTRPSDTSMFQFAIRNYRIAPLTLNQAKTLVKKLPFSEKVKSTFGSLLDRELFLFKQEFAENPRAV